MELVKEKDNLEFQYKDVTFIVRSTATARDKFHLDTRVVLNVNGTGMMKLLDLYEFAIRQFVIGWRGVTQDGQDVPYSFESFEKAFPIDPKDDVFLRLGGFIVSNVGLLPPGEEPKNA